MRTFLEYTWGALAALLIIFCAHAFGAEPPAADLQLENLRLRKVVIEQRIEILRLQYNEARNALAAITGQLEDAEKKQPAEGQPK